MGQRNSTLIVRHGRHSESADSCQWTYHHDARRHRGLWPECDECAVERNCHPGRRFRLKIDEAASAIRLFGVIDRFSAFDDMRGRNCCTTVGEITVRDMNNPRTCILILLMGPHLEKKKLCTEASSAASPPACRQRRSNHDGMCGRGRGRHKREAIHIHK